MKIEFNKLTAAYFSARLGQAKLATKPDIVDFVKETDFEEKLKKILSKRLLQIKQNISWLKMN